MSDPRWPGDGPTWPEHDLDREDDQSPDQPSESSLTDASLDEPPAPVDWEALRREAAWDEPGSDEPWPTLTWERPGLGDEPIDAEVVEEQQPAPDEAPPERETGPIFAPIHDPEPEEAAPPETEPEEAAAPEPEPEVEPTPEPEHEPELEVESMREPAIEGDREAATDMQSEAEEPVTADEVAAEPEPTFEPEPEPEPEQPAFEPEPEPEPWPEPAYQRVDEPEEPSVPTPSLESGAPTMAFDASADAWNPRLQGERRRPTTAEQAVPWLIGIILALAGMVIVLLALIFTSPGGLAGGSASPTPTPSASQVVVAPSIDPTPTPEATETPATETAEPSPAPTASPEPQYGPLEMVFLGRQSALAPIYVLRRDFSTNREAVIMAESAKGISRYAWSPDGRVGACIIDGIALALNPGSAARTLAEGVSAITFGWDAETIYAVRIVRDGGNDRAEVLQMDFADASAETLASVSYPHPAIAAEPALQEAQFIDDGGVARVYAAADGNLVVWILGAPSVYRIDPGNGEVTEVEERPTLWSPDGRSRIVLTENANGTTVIGLQDRTDQTQASTEVTGLVSHIRWAESSNEIVFTLGRLSAGGGVRQDLYVWDLQNGEAPAPLTSNGTSFGAEWVGTRPNWLP